jgi:23S rRNA G2445 N2-methylase RlmL
MFRLWVFDKLTNYKEIYNEDIDRLAEGLREYLQEFNDIGYDVKYEALKIVAANFQEALKND